MRRALGMIALLALGGCASLQKTACTEDDFRALGRDGGSLGRSAEIFPAPQRCTLKPGMSPDLAAYAAGREQGLKLYCRPENAFAVGSRGEPYHGVCEGTGADQFVADYARGAALFALERQAIAARLAVSDAATDLWRVKGRIMQVETTLSNPATRGDDRGLLQAERRDLEGQREALDAAIVAMSQERASAEAALDDFRERLAAAPDAPSVPTLASY